MLLGRGKFVIDALALAAYIAEISGMQGNRTVGKGNYGKRRTGSGEALYHGGCCSRSQLMFGCLRRFGDTLVLPYELAAVHG